MPTFEARMRVIHNEVWTVDAANADEARAKFKELTEDVIEDESGGDVEDWEITSIRQTP